MNKTTFLTELQNITTDGKDTVSLYSEISAAAMRAINEDWKPYAERRAYYFSIEFLIGRAFYNNLLALGVLEEVKRILADKNVDIHCFEEIEDAALGNGGLGRLAACYLDSAAGLGLPLYGYGIRYRYGLFKQAFQNGCQIELPDDWQRFGDPWSVRVEEEKRVIRFADYEVTAVPYDMPIIGERVNTLRLYQAEGSAEAAKISEYLYPPDDTEEGKLLRLRQEYFFSAAAVGELIDRFVALKGKNFASFSAFHAIQLNDTHPVLAIAEFIRVLTQTYRVPFLEAAEYAKQTFHYTNHTILPEALECWPERLLKKILPDICKILVKLNAAEKKEQQALGCTAADIADMAICRDHTVSMANTAVYMGHTVNGVARIHTEILKQKLFATAYRFYPQKFQNKTNGITQRRWLMLCNEELTELIDEQIGRDWHADISRLTELNEHIPKAVNQFILVKNTKKRQLLAEIAAREGLAVPENFLVYAQVKRLHEYKRQLMTALAVLELYHGLLDGSIEDFTPSLFLFGAKSAPSYKRAKGVIRFINAIAARINGDSRTADKLKVVFVQNYNVSYAEKIVAGSDVSLQVSTAGLEASGTGNMKFMLNGAVTCGTMDGANIEIVEKAGLANNYIFGAEVGEIERLKAGGYDPSAILQENPAHKRALDTLIDGTFTDGGSGCYQELYDSLTVGASWHKPDHYFILRDLAEYVTALCAINLDYINREAFAEKQLRNTANAAYFSSDRAIREYAEDIWNIAEKE